MSGKRKQFDWRAIHAELERRLSHLETTIEDDAGRVEVLLRERSIALAQVPRDRRDELDLNRALVFRLGRERYALSLDRAQEVTALSRVAVVPGASAAILGNHQLAWRVRLRFRSQADVRSAESTRIGHSTRDRSAW